jgi:MoxR-like ATPase
MFKILMDYPSKEEELMILDRFTEGQLHSPQAVITATDIKNIQEIVPRLYADIEIKKYVTTIVDATRHPDNYKINLGQYIKFGASPRASIYLILGAKAHALLRGRGYVTPDDVKAVVPDVLRHRILLSYEAEAEEISVDSIIMQIVKAIPVP